MDGLVRDVYFQRRTLIRAGRRPIRVDVGQDVLTEILQSSLLMTGVAPQIGEPSPDVMYGTMFGMPVCLSELPGVHVVAADV